MAIVDTNADPEIIDYPIAGNDDAIRAIRVMLQKLVDAIVSASGEARVREQVEMAGVPPRASDGEVERLDPSTALPITIVTILT